MKEEEASSYQKGITNLLEKHEEDFENIIAEYILDVHNKYYSNTFPSTQICKILIDKLDKKRSKFSIFHKITRNILNKWVDKDLCEIISKKKGHSVKTIVKFEKEGINRLKQKIIDMSIKKIEEGIKNNIISIDSLKTREKILEDMEYEIKDVFSTLELEEE
ncbi:MAG: hypothetical protein EU550_03890 [Promethearchaeota archaeon]|nr:MAG: hypothetical protein EU550_03890 [Candidatus Lokiarchaeota archaeon]